MASYGYEGGYGYAVYLGPSYYAPDYLSGSLNGPGSSAYVDIGHGATGYVHENDNGAVFQQIYVSHGDYSKLETSYSYYGDGFSYQSRTDLVNDAQGMPFDSVSGQPISATSAYFSEQKTTAYSYGNTDVDVVRGGSYSYADGSYANYYSHQDYQRNSYGQLVSGEGSFYNAHSYYDAATGYLTGYSSSFGH